MKTPLAHRRYIWHIARCDGRWPNADEWHYIIVGRWRGF